jgi:hypothetical protein
VDTISSHFKPFAFLIGDWQGTFADGKTTDRQHFEWLHDGKLLSNHHSSTGERGGHSGDAVFAYDTVEKRIVFWYWDNAGGITLGHFTVRGDDLHADEEYRGEQNYKMRTVWKPIDGDNYDSSVFAQQEGEWKQLWTVRYKRVATRP